MRVAVVETIESHSMRLDHNPSPPQAGASLDNRTPFDGVGAHPVFSERRGEYSVAVYPDAAEAVICRVPQRIESDLDDEGPCNEERPDFAERDPELLAKDSWERSNRRAFSESRRYFVANRLRYMWVLTFTGDGLHGPEGRKECMRLVALFMRRFRAAFGPMPYWGSPELHPGGHGWHVNLFVPRRLPHDQIQHLWAERVSELPGVSTGMVHVSDKTKDRRVAAQNLSFVEALRLGALYGCKYASKDWSPEQILPGEHRYVSGHDYKPEKIQMYAFTEGGAVELAVGLYGLPPTWCWRSAECEDWDGPDVVCLRWNQPRVKGAGDG